MAHRQFKYVQTLLCQLVLFCSFIAIVLNVTAVDPECTQASPIALYSSGTAAVFPCNGLNFVDLVTSTGSSSRLQTGCKAAFGAVADPAAGTVYLVCNQGHVMSVATNGAQLSESVCQNPTGVVWDPARQFLFAGCAGNSVWRYAPDLSAPTQITNNSVCRYPWGMTIDASTSTLYVACSAGPPAAIAINPDFSVTTLLSTSQYPGVYNIAFNPVTGNVIAFCWNSGAKIAFFVSINSATLTSTEVSSSAISACYPSYATFDAVSGTMYASCSTTGAGILAMSPFNQETTTLSAGGCSQPFGITYSSISNVLFISCGTSPYIVQLGCSTGTVLNTTAGFCGSCPAAATSIAACGALSPLMSTVLIVTAISLSLSLFVCLFMRMCLLAGFRCTVGPLSS